MFVVIGDVISFVSWF